MEQCCDEFEAAWRAGERPTLAEFVSRLQPGLREQGFSELLAIEAGYRRKNAEYPTPEEYVANFPEFAEQIRREFAAVEQTQILSTTVTVSSSGAQPTPERLLQRIDDYELLEEIARGGMGVVYKARQLSLDRTVAVKLIRETASDSSDHIDRFLVEQRAAAALRHPGIVSVFSAGRCEGQHFYSMELVEGDTLSEVVQQRCTPQEAARIVRDCAAAVHYAHEHGVLHRDLKPSNILLDRDGHVRITDFGLAKRMSVNHELTATGQIIGTPSYMSPEQAAGDPDAVDCRTDLYSLGAVLYALLTGRPPHEGKSITATLLSVAQTPPRPPREIDASIDAELNQICLKCLAKSPERRYQTAAELAEALDSYLSRSSGKTVVSRLPSNGTRTPRWVAAAVGLFAVMALGVFVVRMSTDRGELVIETSDPQVAVRIQKSGIQIHDPVSQRRYELRAGSQFLKPGHYLIAVSDDTGLRLESTEFRIERQGEVVIKAWLEPTKSVVPPVTPQALEVLEESVAAASSDNEQPFVVVRENGQEVAASTFERALKLHQDGDAIEIHGNGPFRLQGYEVQGKRLTLRAAPGYRPQFRVDVSQNFLTLRNVSFAVEGCDFRCPFVGGSTSYLFAGDGPEWSFKNCKFLIGTGFVARYTGPKLALQDCLITVAAGFGGGPWLEGAVDELEVVNCVGRVPHPLLPMTPRGDSATIRLERNTFVCQGNFFGKLDDPNLKGKRYVVRASGNLIERNQSNGNFLFPSYGAWREKVDWTGENNLYVQTVAGSEVVFGEGDDQRKATGMAAWNELWGKPEPGTTEVLAFAPHWRSIEMAGTPQKLIDAVKSTVDAYNSKLPNLGPDWSLVGPGDGYLWALAAAGRPVAKERLRPRPIEGAVFVLVRQGKVFQGYDRLALASAAAVDGDVIEIRTDDVVQGLDLPVAAGVKSLTIRAAPGYRPTFEGWAGWLRPGLTLTVEGLHFQAGGLSLREYSETGKGCRLARLANCSFGRDLLDGAAHCTLGSPFSYLQPAEGGTMEIVNCLIPESIQLYCDAGAKVSIENSLVARFWCNQPDVEGRFQLQIRRSVLWNPPAYFGPWCTYAGGQTELHIDDSLIESASGFVIWGNPKQDVVPWKGDRNVYRLGEQLWCQIHGAQAPEITSLGAWKREWSSDAHSLQADPTVYDPRAWQVAAGSPGEGFGANVDRIGIAIERPLVVATPTSSEAPKTPALTSKGVPDIAPDAAPTFAPRQPLGATALVVAPAPIAGIDSWTFETVGHRGGITSCSYRADSREVATSSFDGTVRIWDPTDGKLLRVFVTPSPIDAMVWSPEGGLIAATGSDEQLRFLRADDGRTLWTLKLTRGRASRLAWSPDGSRLAVGGGGGLALWDAREMTLVMNVNEPAANVQHVVWSPDGARLAAFDGKSLHVVNAKSGAHITAIETGPIATVAWLPEPLGLTTANDKVVRSWNLEDLAATPQLGNFDEPVVSLAATLDGKRALVGLAGGAAQVRELETGDIVRTTPAPDPTPGIAHWTGLWWSAGAVWSPDGRTAVDPSAAGNVSFRTPRGGQRVVHHYGMAANGPFAWSPKGTLAHAPWFNPSTILCAWKLNQADFYSSDETPTDPHHPRHVNCTAMAWSRDGAWLATGGGDPQTIVWDENLRRHKLWSFGDNAQWNLAYSRDGSRLAVGAIYPFARLLDVASDETAKPDVFETGFSPRFAWSPTEDRLASASGDKLTFHDLANGKALETLTVGIDEKPLGRVEAIDWSPDGKRIAVGGETLQVFDVAEKRFILKIVAKAFVRTLQFSSDGARLLTGEGDDAAIYDVASGENLQRWTTSPGVGVRTAQWSPGNKFVAFGSDRTIVADVTTGERVFDLMPLSGTLGGLVTSQGHWRLSQELPDPFIYVVQSQGTQHTLSPAEFEKRYGWKNNSAQVKLLP